jgi:hypothetical protein
MILALLTSLFLSTTPAAPAPMRVYFARLTPGSGASADLVLLVEEKLLVASRQHIQHFAVLGAGDGKRILDVSALQQTLDCTAESCLTDVADALGAPQLISGQLGRLGETWLLTLTRIDRNTMEPLARVSRESKGDTPEALLAEANSIMAELLVAPAAPAAPATKTTTVPGEVESSTSTLVFVCASAGVVGIAAAVVGAVLVNRVRNNYTENTKIVEGKRIYDGSANIDVWRADGKKSQIIALSVLSAGAVVTVAGAVLLTAGLASGE